MHQLITLHPLGTLVAMTPRGLDANHVPFVIDPEPQPNGTLRCHVAKANPIWQDLTCTSDVLVIFHGPDAYVSPSTYPSKHEDGKVVPTWNYVTVHAYGRPRVVTDSYWLRNLVEDLTREHERGRAAPWQVSDAPAQYIDKLLRAIVGVEIPISRLMGKWKVSQNRSVADRAGVAADLRRESESQAEIAQIVAQTLPAE
jgi:transcriptional regulator